MEQKLNSNTKDDGTTSSHTCTKPHVVGCAYDVVKILGQEFEPLQGVYYITDIDYKELDDYNSFDYCQNCAIEIANKENLLCLQESSPEKEGFCTCENCSKIIETSIIWTKQEIEHWLTNLQKEHLKDKATCYELMKLLEPTYGAYENFPKEVTEISNRVLSLA